MQLLYKIDDTVVFYSPILCASVGALYNGLRDGSKTAYSIEGAIIPIDSAIEALTSMSDFMQNPVEKSEQVYRNLLVAPRIITAVRVELIDESTSCIGDLSDVIQLVSLGMFDTAIQVLTTVTPTSTLTTARLTKWVSLLEVSNSVI